MDHHAGGCVCSAGAGGCQALWRLVRASPYLPPAGPQSGKAAVNARSRSRRVCSQLDVWPFPRCFGAVLWPLLTSAGSAGPYDPGCCPGHLAEARVSGRSPRVRTPTFSPHPPSLPPRPLAASGFAVPCQLTQAERPHPRFVVLEPWICLQLPPHTPSRTVQLPLANGLVLPRPWWTFATESTPMPGAQGGHHP